MKTSTERGAQEESGGDQSPLTEGAAGRAAVPPSSEVSDGEGVAARREGGISAEDGKDSSSSSPAMRVLSLAPSPCVADGGF